VLSIVIPTYNERDNIPVLFKRISESLRGVEYEVVVVDDNSPDGTADLVSELRSVYPNVKVVRRAGKLGLSSAVLDGIKHACGDVIAVMDADLQHPPEVLPVMYGEILKGADVVIASRYIRGGSVGSWSFLRKLISRVAIVMAKILVPRARGVGDPISGYFMFRRDVIKGCELNPKGFKILLEVLARGKYSKVSEVPYTFGVRYSGRSKLSPYEVLNYVHHLLTLTPYVRVVKFGLVGLVGTVVNLTTLYILTYLAGIEHFISSAAAIELSIINNFTLHEVWTFRDRRVGRWVFRLLKFHLSTSASVLTQYATSQALHYILGMESVISQFSGIVVGFVINYVLSSKVVWGGG